MSSVAGLIIAGVVVRDLIGYNSIRPDGNTDTPEPDTEDGT
jgi:hypothetical protein